MEMEEKSLLQTWPRPQQRLWQEYKKQGIIIPGPVNMDLYEKNKE